MHQCPVTNSLPLVLASDVASPWQGGASSALYKPLGVLSTMRTAAQALHPSAAGASGTHVQQPSAAKLDAPRVHNSAAKPASPPKVTPTNHNLCSKTTVTNMR